MTGTRIVLKIRVKYMLSSGASEQSSITSGQPRTGSTNSGRLETNSENLLRMVLTIVLVTFVILE